MTADNFRAKLLSVVQRLPFGSIAVVLSNFKEVGQAKKVISDEFQAECLPCGMVTLMAFAEYRVFILAMGQAVVGSLFATEFDHTITCDFSRPEEEDWFLNIVQMRTTDEAGLTWL